MKPTLLLTLSFFLFTFTTTLPLGFSDQVLDRHGKPLSDTGRYYILPAIFGPTGGGLELDFTSNYSTCPNTVRQDNSEAVHGLPVKFSVQGRNPGSGTIFTGTHLDIAFEKKPECASSSKWVVVGDDFPQKWVGIGSAKDHPGNKVINGSFNIQQSDVGYKLVFCATINVRIPVTCFDIGRYNVGNGKRLILTNGSPYQVEFLDA